MKTAYEFFWTEWFYSFDCHAYSPFYPLDIPILVPMESGLPPLLLGLKPMLCGNKVAVGIRKKYVTRLGGEGSGQKGRG